MKQIQGTVEITYEQYAAVLANVAGQEVAFGFALPAVLTKLGSDLKGFVSQLAEEFKASVKDIVAALMNKDVYNLLKAVKFNLKTMYKAVDAFTGLIHRGLLHSMKQFVTSPLFQQLKDGVSKIDDVLAQYPILKRLTGLALAGFLLWAWWHMAFTGHPASDFDISSVIAAFNGQFQLADLMNEAGLEMIVLVVIGTHTAAGLGIVWMGQTIYNLVIALVFLGAKQANKTGLARSIANGIKQRMSQ